MSTIEPATWKKVESEPVKLVALAASSGSAALLDGIKSRQRQKGNRQARIEHLDGLSWRRPWAARRSVPTSPGFWLTGGICG